MTREQIEDCIDEHASDEEILERLDAEIEHCREFAKNQST